MDNQDLPPNNQPPAPDGQDRSRQQVETCIQTLVHACRCKTPGCRLASCQRLKQVVAHIKVCRRRTRGGCAICKHLVALCCYHSRHCQDAACPIPFCRAIKNKIEQQYNWLALQRRRREVLFRHRNARPRYADGG